VCLYLLSWSKVDGRVDMSDLKCALASPERRHWVVDVAERVACGGKIVWPGDIWHGLCEFTSRLVFLEGDDAGQDRLALLVGVCPSG
jgi:hypothetical protein